MSRLLGPPSKVLRAAARRSAKAFAALPNVTHVSVGEKISDGRKTGLLALKVYVERKADVALADRIPAFVDLLSADGTKVGEARTDVVETDAAPQLLGLRSGHTLRAFDSDQGVAAISFSKGARGYALTNAHVACDIAQAGATGPMQWAQGGEPTPLGSVIYWTPITPGVAATADMAVVLVNDEVGVDDYRIANHAGEITRLDIIRKSSLTHWFVAHGEVLTCTDPEPVDGDTDIRVDGAILTFKGFWQFKMTPGLVAKKGMSGSLICRTVNGAHVACGLLFAGLLPGYVWAFPFKPAFDRVYSNLPS